MSSSNKTETLNLTQYTNTDIISFLDDYNVDMQKIDAFANTKNQNGGLASIDSNGKIYPMPTTSDVSAAPINHSSTGTSFGVASLSAYGHVKYGTVSGTACQGNDQRLTPVGSIQIWPHTTTPNGYLLCQGQAVSRTTYASLFAILGVSYGSGDGSTTFNLPDLQRRIPVGYQSGDTDFGTFGNAGGNTQQTLYAMVGNPSGMVNQLAFNETAAPPNVTFSRRYENLTMAGGPFDASNSSAVLRYDGSAPTTIQPHIVMNYMIKY